ncbi:MAG: sugar transferase [Candidatus Eisenbacteria bacterium]|uniref:Sugar transferase n=1 Tax=Eiseniibacteriota bacterium TaxID=2212470 RepID=A0A849SMF2_UNCEI|nr:sugar transferase [Candidatus Eisenbacteria bacterium]
MEPEILASPTSDTPADSIGRGGPIASSVTLSPDSRSRSHAYLDAGLAAEASRAAESRTPVGALGYQRVRSSGRARANGHSDAWAPRVRTPSTLPAVTAVPAHPVAVDTGLYLKFGKRVLDLLAATVALILLAPVIAAIAIAIKLESHGPILYFSRRVGRNGRAFWFLKFRSMVVGADRNRHHLSHLNECDGPIFKISRDPRVTRVGRFLRVTSLDEIPQFVNVLIGDMSLVGPRPPIPEEVEQYEPWQWRRLDVKPGITCLWQISGRSRLSFKEWMRLDLEYIKHRSLWLDLRILLRTLPAVLSREGAY